MPEAVRGHGFRNPWLQELLKPKLAVARLLLPSAEADLNSKKPRKLKDPNTHPLPKKPQRPRSSSPMNLGARRLSGSCLGSTQGFRAFGGLLGVLGLFFGALVLEAFTAQNDVIGDFWGPRVFCDGA